MREALLPPTPNDETMIGGQRTVNDGGKLLQFGEGNENEGLKKDQNNKSPKTTDNNGRVEAKLSNGMEGILRGSER